MVGVPVENIPHFLCPTGRVWISQPAKKDGRCVERREE
jgi:hypothetical protein